MLKIRLKELRTELNITQEELAKKINLTRSSVSGYENGSKIPTIDTVILLSNFFNVSTDYLLGLSNMRTFDNELGINKDTGLAINKNKEPAINKDNFIKVFKVKYDKLDDDFKYAMHSIGTTLIDNLYTLQSSKQKNVSKDPVDEDIEHELESYRQELLSNNNLIPKSTNAKKEKLN